MCFGICLQVQSFHNVVGKMESAFMWPGLNKALYCGAGEVAALPKTKWSSQLSMAGKLLHRERGGVGADSPPKSRKKCKFGVNWKDWSISNYKVKLWSWEFGCCCALVILGWCSFLKICARYLSPWGLKMTHLWSVAWRTAEGTGLLQPQWGSLQHSVAKRIESASVLKGYSII